MRERVNSVMMHRCMCVTHPTGCVSLTQLGVCHSPNWVCVSHPTGRVTDVTHCPGVKDSSLVTRCSRRSDVFLALHFIPCINGIIS